MFHINYNIRRSIQFSALSLSVGSLAMLSLICDIQEVQGGTATYSAGQWTGVSNLYVGGVVSGYYDVSFVDSSCFSIFSGCDADSDFAPAGPAGTNYFAYALRDFINGGNVTMADSDPSKTFGISSTSEGLILIPQRTNVDPLKVQSFRVENRPALLDAVVVTLLEDVY